MSHVSGSGRLSTRNPMLLAIELLEQRDHPPVITFLDACTRIYGFPVDSPVLRKWKSEVQQGKMPDFSVTYIN